MKITIVAALQLAYELLRAHRVTAELKDRLFRRATCQIYGTELGNLKADAADKVID